MRTGILLPLVILFTIHTYSQTTFDTKKKCYFFKTWNWLKYYHPDLATGKVPADSLFLHYFPAIDQARDNKSVNQVLRQLLNTLTTPAPQAAAGKPVAQKGLLTKNIDTAWLTHENFISPAVRHTLRQVYKNRHIADSHYYVPAKGYDTEIPHEPTYTFPDSLNITYEYRMLALAKLQGAVDYLFPHKYLMDKNWNTTVLHFIPLFTACDARWQYEKLLLNITSTFNDTHTWPFYKSMKNRKRIFRNQYYPPFEYQLIDNKVLVTGIIVEELCNKAGIRKGDFITALDGVSVANRIKELSALLSTSNSNALLYRLGVYTNNMFFAAEKPLITIRSLKDGKTTVSELPLIQVKDTAWVRSINNYFAGKNRAGKPGAGLTWLDSGVVYFKTNSTYRFIEETPDDKIEHTMDSLFTLAAKSRGMIFDMRDYPDWGGFVGQLYRKFGKAPVKYGRYYAVNKKSIGTYALLESEDIYYPPGITPQHALYTGKIVIIVNPETHSMSEWNTMNLQTLFPQSITIGQQTSGADGDVKTLNLPGNYGLQFTGNAIFYPDGTVAQRKGVKINIPLYPSAKELLSGQDMLLEKALELIRSNNQ